MKRSSLIILLAVALCTIPRMAIGSTHDAGSVRGRSSPARTLAVRSDFNGDGYSDLAVGEADEDVGTIVDAGGVNVIYGSTSGLNAQRNQFWTQDTSGILDQSEQSDAFGRAVATGDLNGDGYADLVIGAPFEVLDSGFQSGAVNVIYGSVTGLNAAAGPGNQFWNRGSPGIDGDPGDGDSFGRYIAVADFNQDGYADAAIAAGGAALGTVTDAGVVHVLYGSAVGLTADGSQMWTEDLLSSTDGSEKDDEFGQERLTPGDYNGDGFPDLAVAIRQEDVGSISSAGAAAVIYGSAAGLSSAGNQWWTQDELSSTDGSETGDKFSRYMGSGDFNGDGYDDLAIASRDEDVGTIVDAGSVTIVYGSPTGLDATAGPGNQFWVEDDLSSSDGSEKGDLFARAVVGADFNADGYWDLAIGIRDESLEDLSIAACGAVAVIYGSANGLDPAAGPGNQFWIENDLNNTEGSEANDRVPVALTWGDYNADGYSDVVWGDRHEDIGLINEAGAVVVVYGSANGLTARHNQFWSQDSPKIKDRAEAEDAFGDNVA
jgi:hypothetical protein